MIPSRPVSAGAHAPTPTLLRLAPALAVALLLGLPVLGGCSEDSPEFRDLASPAEEEAVPLESEILEKKPEARERAEERVGERLEAREARDVPDDAEAVPDEGPGGGS